MKTKNVSIKSFIQWRRGIKRNGNVLCSPTTGGLWQGMTLASNTSDSDRQKTKTKKKKKKKKKQQKNTMISFVFGNELT